ncbi:hypothetical protein QN397_26210, partial [Variovorax sp. RTB1]|uniref:hypothetical protein n=1 Tax=Variovorax sp. RTB1 TaxID=3048631 RepID=UPI002B23CB82
NSPVKPPRWRPDLNQSASTNPGAIHLRFANKRRGITPGAEELCNWYAGLHGKRPGNVRRYIKTLMDAKVLHSTHLLGRLFQRTGGTALDHLSEDEQAAALYQGLRQRNFDPINSVEKRTGPTLLVASEVANLDTVMEAERSEWYARTLPEMSGSLSSTVRKPAPVLDCCLFPEYLRREAMALL